MDLDFFFLAGDCVAEGLLDFFLLLPPPDCLVLVAVPVADADAEGEPVPVADAEGDAVMEADADGEPEPVPEDVWDDDDVPVRAAVFVADAEAVTEDVLEAVRVAVAGGVSVRLGVAVEVNDFVGLDVLVEDFVCEDEGVPVPVADALIDAVSELEALTLAVDDAELVGVTVAVPVVDADEVDEAVVLTEEVGLTDEVGLNEDVAVVLGDAVSDPSCANTAKAPSRAKRTVFILAKTVGSFRLQLIGQSENRCRLQRRLLSVRRRRVIREL